MDKCFKYWKLTGFVQTGNNDELVKLFCNEKTNKSDLKVTRLIPIQ